MRRLPLVMVSSYLPILRKFGSDLELAYLSLNKHLRFISYAESGQ